MSLLDLFTTLHKIINTLSNAIEGNTLTLNETATIILDSTIPGSKSVREVFEVLNHKKAIDYMLTELANDRKLDIYVIKNINLE